MWLPLCKWCCSVQVCIAHSCLCQWKCPFSEDIMCVLQQSPLLLCDYCAQVFVMVVSHGAHTDNQNQEWWPLHHVNCTMIWNPILVIGFHLTSFINCHFSVASWESTRWWGGACPALKCATPRSTRWESSPQTRPPPSPDSGTSWVSCASWRRRPARSSAAAGSVVCINYCLSCSIVSGCCYACVSCSIVSGCYFSYAHVVSGCYCYYI